MGPMGGLGRYAVIGRASWSGVRQLAARSTYLLGVLFVVLVFTVAPARASSGASWYHAPSSSGAASCWLQGSFEEYGSHTGSQCDGTGAAGYVTEHMIKNTNDVEDYKQSQTGDYCSYSGLSDTLNQPVGTENLFADKYATPLSSFQEGDGHFNVCANWAANAEFKFYRYRCSSRPTICYFGGKEEVNKEKGGGCIPSEELCECGYNGFSCECYNSGETCWKCVPSGCGEAIEKVTCPKEQMVFHESEEDRGGNCEVEQVHPEEPSSWGFDLENAEEGETERYECPKNCAMQHYVSLAGQGLDDHPWANYFGEPLLTVGNTIKPLQLYPSGQKAWGYLCPVLEEAGGEKHIIELCFEQWRGSANGAEWKTEHAESCTEPSGLNHTVSRVIALFGSGTQFATERAGSANTEVYSNDNEKSFGASVSTSNLENVVKAANEHCSKKSSLAPSEWSLIGVASGVEALEAARNMHLSAEEHGLSVETEYKQLPPVVSAETATEISARRATVAGTVNPNGEYAYSIVEYGTTPAYGHATGERYIGTGTNPVPTSTALTELLPGTTYHYRILEYRYSPTEKEAVSGPEQTFTTLPEAPTVVTEVASVIAKTSATLNAKVTPDGATVTTCKFEYGPTETYGKSVSCASLPGSGDSPVEVSAAPPGLSETTTYHFRIVATNSVGTSNGSGKTFETYPYAPTVATEAASSITKTTVTLNASVNPDDATVSACKFEYGTTTSYGKSASCASLPGSGTSPVEVSAALSGLSEHTTYHFRIVATNSVGTSDGSDEMVTTYPYAPEVVTDAASKIGSGGGTLNATVNPEDATVTECYFQYGTTVSYGSSTPCSTSPGSGEAPVRVSADAIGLSEGSYDFRVVSKNSVGASYGANEAFATRVPCEGANIAGSGSWLQQRAQQFLWIANFNTSLNESACSGHGVEPTVTYHGVGSGPGIDSWGANEYRETNFGPGNAFIATDEPPNEAEELEIEKRIQPQRKPSKVLTIPVAQSAIAIVMHLPRGCEGVTEGPAPGRIALTDGTLEKVFAGADTEWKQILNGAKLVGNAECSSSSKITRVVESEGSGVTAILKKFLYLINKKVVYGSSTWKQLAEGNLNTLWPGGGVVSEPGVGGVIGTVAENPGMIGAADLPDARANGSFTPPRGGEGKATFWAKVESNTAEEEGKTTDVYSDPSSNGDVEMVGSSNCEATSYTNGSAKFPPPSAELEWNEVTTARKEPHYALCGLTYILALTKYSSYYGTTEGEVQTLNHYLQFVLNARAEGGQRLLESNDYLPDPTSETELLSVLDIARKGAQKIGF